MFESLSLVDTLLSYPGIIVFLMFSLLMALMLTGQRVFGVLGFIGVAARSATASTRRSSCSTGTRC